MGEACRFYTVLAKPFCREFGIVCGEQELSSCCSIFRERRHSDAEGIAGCGPISRKPARRIGFGGRTQAFCQKHSASFVCEGQQQGKFLSAITGGNIRVAYVCA